MLELLSRLATTVRRNRATSADCGVDGAWQRDHRAGGVGSVVWVVEGRHFLWRYGCGYRHTCVRVAQHQIDGIGVHHVVSIENSVGDYAAMLSAALLYVGDVVAFVPQIFIACDHAGRLWWSK